MYQILNSIDNIAFIITPIFYKILYMSIVASVIGLLIITLRRVFNKKLSPTWNMILWCIFIIALTIPIKLELSNNIYNVMPIKNIEKISYIEEYNNTNDEFNELLNNEIMKSGLIEKNNLDNSKLIQTTKSKLDIISFKSIIFDLIIPYLWIIGIFSIAIFYIISYNILNRKLGTKYVEDKRLINILEYTKNKLKIKRDIKLIEQNYINMPSIFGVFNVRILINKKLYEMTDEQIRYIFLHELSHYIKKDNIINILIMIIQSIHWFNPFIWIIFREIRKDIEILTDKIAIGQIEKEEYKKYCRTLVEIASLENNINLLPKVLCISDNKKNLERRINMIKLSDFFIKRKLLIGITSVIIIAILSVFLVSTQKVNSSEGLIVINTYNNPIIPNGFKKVETSTASWELQNGIPKGWNNGLVIEDELGNQFVWVPVNINNINYSSGYKENFKIYNKNSMDENGKEDSQILKYGGFYIARYEAGVSNEMQSKLNNISEEINDIQGIPVSKKGVRPWDFISLKNAKINATSMYKTNQLESDLVTEKQWITIMQWLSIVGYKVSNNSSDWGNFSNVNFKFTGIYSIDYGKNYQYGENKNKETYNMILSSGATDRNMANNIYDLAGNLLEYTDEYTDHNGGGYLCAGGHFDNTGGYSADTLSLINTKPLDKVGFRVVLYIK